MIARLARIALVVAGLALAGAVLGAAAGGGALTTAYVLKGYGPGGHYSGAGMITEAAWLGGGLGLVLGPVCALGLLRRAPLWLVLVGPTLATYLAGAVGELAGAGIVAAPMGFMVAVSVVSLLGERPVAARAPAAAAARPGRSPSAAPGAGGVRAVAAARLGGARRPTPNARGTCACRGGRACRACRRRT